MNYKDIKTYPAMNVTVKELLKINKTHISLYAVKRIEELEEVLAEIAKGEGRYNADKLQHAVNTIDDMKAIANKAINHKAE